MPNGEKHYLTHYDGQTEKARALLESPDVAKLGHNLLFDVKFLHYNGFKIQGMMWDSRILAHLLDENNSVGLKELTKRYFGEEFLTDKSELDKAIAASGTSRIDKFIEKDLSDPTHPYAEIIGRYCLEDIENTFKLYQFLCKKLQTVTDNLKRHFPEQQNTLITYYRKEALPFLQAQFALEKEGLTINMEAVEDYKRTIVTRSNELKLQMDELVKDEIAAMLVGLRKVALEKHLAKMKTEAGKQRLIEEQEKRVKVSFKWTKQDQITELLINHLKVSPTFFGKTPSGNKYALTGYLLEQMQKKLAPLSKAKKLVDLLLEYKKVQKLRTTYLGEEMKKGFLSKIEEGRVYPEYSPFLVTGRLACSNPNVQQIPRGSPVKRFFVPSKPDTVIVHADASQVELRIAAHLSQDEDLCEAYITGRDLHKQTAEAMFDVKDVTPEQRQCGKSANFLMIYDGSAKVLQNQIATQAKLEFSVEQCQDFRQAFFHTYSRYKDYLGEQLQFVRRYGIAVSDMGRIRRLPDIQYGQYLNWQQKRFIGPPHLKEQLVAKLIGYKMQVTDATIFEAASKLYSHAKKQAYNFPVQCLGASITKLAIIKLQEAGFRVICTVHDSIDIELPINHLDRLQQIQYILENAYRLSVPLKWDVKLLNSFDEADKFQGLLPSKKTG